MRIVRTLDPLDRAALGLAGGLLRGLAIVGLAAAILAGRYLAGWPLISPVTTGATWTRAGRVPQGRPWPRIGWRYWPLWQRAALRWVALGLAGAAWTWPTWTALAAAVVTSGTTGAALAVRYRHARPPFARRTLRARVVREVSGA